MSAIVNLVLVAALIAVSAHYDLPGDVAQRLGLAEETPGVDPSTDAQDRFGLYADTPHRVAVIGDSHVAIAEWDALLGLDDVASRGIGGDVAQGVLERIDQLRPLEPEVVLLQVGHNDLAAGRAPDEVARRIDEIVEAIAAMDAAALVATVPPVARSEPGAADFNRRTRELNARLVESARSSSVHIVDLAGEVSDDDGFLPASLTFDGRHLAAEGYRRWRDVVVGVLGELEISG